jgi:hypothetical protein
MINGRFEFASTQALSEEQAKAGSEQSNQSGTATSSPAEPVRRSELNLDEESGATPPEENITGTLQIDVLSALMDGFPSLREKYFTLDGDYARIEVALDGPLASCSDKLARQIDEDIKLLVTRTQFEN